VKASPAARHRAYEPGEDRSKDADLVCQGPTDRHYKKVCNATPVTKVGRYRVAGGWHDVYDCPKGHRFGVTLKNGLRKVIDIPKEKPTFGGGLGF
jgi:hypothetical protein